MLDEEVAGPESVDLSGGSFELLDVALERDEPAAVDAEDLEEVVPEALALGVLARFALSFLDEGIRLAADVADRQHR